MNELSSLANSFIKLKSEGHSVSEILEILNIDRFQMYLIYEEIRPKKSNKDQIKEWRKNNREKIKEYNLKNKYKIQAYCKDPNRTLQFKVYRFKTDKREKGSIPISSKTTRIMLQIKISSFSKDLNRKTQKTMFTVDQLLEKIGDSPKCYLTGRPIDITKGETYHLDHIVPRTKGGDNSLENCNIACKEANIAKSNLDLEDFYKLCEEVLNNRVSQLK